MGQLLTLALIIGVFALLERSQLDWERQKSVLGARQPLDLEELSFHFPSQAHSRLEVLRALRFVGTVLTEAEVSRLRPGDTFADDLAYLGKGMDSDLQNLFTDLAVDFDLSQSELDELCEQVLTVQDFLEAQARLASRRLERVWPAVAL